MLMHQIGRDAGKRSENVQQVRRIVAAFHDSPASPFSIHSICRAGAAYGLVAGRWMGPYAICRALADIAATATEPNLSILTLDSGGGAPCIDPDMCALLIFGRGGRQFESICCLISNNFFNECKLRRVGA
jgi:hypothetical protein